MTQPGPSALVMNGRLRDAKRKGPRSRESELEGQREDKLRAGRESGGPNTCIPSSPVFLILPIYHVQNAVNSIREF